MSTSKAQLINVIKNYNIKCKQHISDTNQFMRDIRENVENYVCDEKLNLLRQISRDHDISIEVLASKYIKKGKMYDLFTEEDRRIKADMIRDARISNSQLYIKCKDDDGNEYYMEMTKYGKVYDENHNQIEMPEDGPAEEELDLVALLDADRIDDLTKYINDKIAQLKNIKI